jgi:predicted ATP-dependent serine protease
MENKVCSHLSAIKTLKKAKDYVCEECVKTHGRWMHLRTCQECGITLCCDSSPNQHASKHANETGHPVVISAEPGERWLWCYFDEEIAEY